MSYEQGIEKAAEAVYSQYYGPSMGEIKPKTREVQIAMAAVEAFLSEQPTIQWCEVHTSRVRVGPGGRPGDERCERAELHLAFDPAVAVRACRMIEQKRVTP